MEDMFDDEESDLDMLDEAVADIAATRVKYFKMCKKLHEKMSDLEDSIMINQISRQSEINNQTVEVISVPEVKLPNLSHFSAQDITQKQEHLNARVKEFNKILKMMDRRSAEENSVRLSAGDQLSLFIPKEADRK